MHFVDRLLYVLPEVCLFHSALASNVETRHWKWIDRTGQKVSHLGHTCDRWLWLSGCFYSCGWWFFCEMLISPAGWSLTCTLCTDSAQGGGSDNGSINYTLLFLEDRDMRHLWGHLELLKLLWLIFFHNFQCFSDTNMNLLPVVKKTTSRKLDNENHC